MSFTEDIQNPDEFPGVVAMEYLEIDEADELDDVGAEDLAAGAGTGRIASLAKRIAPDRSVLTSGLGMSAAGLAALVIGSTLHRRSPWSGINAITGGLGLVGRRSRRRFDTGLTAVSLATIVGGSLVVAAIANKLTPSRGIGRIGGGVLAALGSLAIDRFLMRRQLLPALTHSLGPVGTIAKYGAIGLGAMLGRRAL